MMHGRQRFIYNPTQMLEKVQLQKALGWLAYGPLRATK